MQRSDRTPLPRWLLLLSAIPSGCAALHRETAPTSALLPSATTAASPDRPGQPASALRQAAFDLPAHGQVPACPSKPDTPPFVGMSELSVDALVAQVLAHNPSLAQMAAAWQAASARYPQVTALDDPMFGATIAPASIGSNEVDF